MCCTKTNTLTMVRIETQQHEVPMNQQEHHKLNPNFVPNTSAIPNILFDFWMEKLSPAEFKVLMCIARKTYGWHKEVDRISLKQIEKMTGLHKSGIVKNMASLIEFGLVIKIKNKTSDGDDAPNQYEINIYCVEGGSLFKTPPLVDSVDNRVVYSADTQKKDYTKEKYDAELFADDKRIVYLAPPQSQAVADALEAAANICDEYANDNWALYKGHQPYKGDEDGRANSYVEGLSDGADECGTKIRALIK